MFDKIKEWITSFFMKKFVSGAVKTATALVVAQSPVLHNAGVDLTINQDLLVTFIGGLIAALINMLKNKFNVKLPV